MPPIPRVRVNLAANLASNIWVAILGIVFPPIFARWMGIEAYGLVGLFVSLTSVLSMLDIGLGTTLTREMARLSARDDEEGRGALRDLLRTGEVLYLVLGVAFGGTLLLLAPLFARYWVTPVALSADDVTACVRMMAIAVGLQCAQNAYTGVLNGLEQGVVLGVVRSLGTVFRSVGALGALASWGKTPNVFFGWQIASGVFTAVLLGWGAYRATKASRGGRVKMELFSSQAGFAVGVWSSALLGILFSQADRLVIGKLVPLDSAGRYALATTVTGVLYSFAVPVFSAVLPRYTRLAEAGNEKELASLHRAATQTMVVLVVPAALTLAAFAREVMRVWLRDDALATALASVVVFRALGTAVQCLAYQPAALTLAYGKTRLNTALNAVACVAYFPLAIVLGRSHGGAGVALAWTIVVTAVLLVWVFLVHRVLPVGPAWRWLVLDVVMPSFGAFAVAYGAHALVPIPDSRFGALAVLGVIGIFAMGATTLLSPNLRAFVLVETRRRLRAR